MLKFLYFLGRIGRYFHLLANKTHQQIAVTFHDTVIILGCDCGKVFWAPVKIKNKIFYLNLILNLMDMKDTKGFKRKLKSVGIKVIKS